jgi:2-dehydropantoate 2-reductase
MAMIAVVGVGAIGGVCAAHLLARRSDLVCCVRRPFPELVLEEGGRVLRCRPRVESQPARVGVVDWVLLATKAHQTEGARPWLEALVGSETRVAVLQNGVEHVERLSRQLPAAQLLPVVVACPATAVSPGHVVQRRPARLTVPRGRAGLDFADLFSGTDVTVEVSGDWATAAWRKLCMNVTTGALAALAGVPLPEIRHPQRAALAHALARECARVARAEGADLPDAFAQEVADGAANARLGGAPSTLTDRLHGRPLEADARNGAVVRIGARHGIETPLNARATELMRDAHRDRETDWLPALAEALPR